MTRGLHLNSCWQLVFLICQGFWTLSALLNIFHYLDWISLSLVWAVVCVCHVLILCAGVHVTSFGAIAWHKVALPQLPLRPSPPQLACCRHRATLTCRLGGRRAVEWRGFSKQPTARRARRPAGRRAVPCIGAADAAAEPRG